VNAQPTVKVTVGQFNYVSNTRETQVHVRISQDMRTSYYLPADQADQLRSLPWPQAVQQAHEYWADRVFVDTSAEQKRALAEWLAVDENRDALYEAWRQDQIERHPVARELAAEVVRLASVPEQIGQAAERVVRQQQGRGATAAEIVQALVDAALLTRTVRPGVEPAASGGAR
jgi:hypothetical protein